MAAQLARRRAEGLPEGPVESRQAVEPPREGDVGDGPAAGRIHDRRAAFLEPPSRHVLREARSARLEQAMQVPDRHPERCRRALRRQRRIGEMQVDIALGLFEPRQADQLRVLARHGAGGHRQEPPEIVGDQGKLALVECVDLVGESIEVGFHHAGDAARPGQGDGTGVQRNRQMGLEEPARDDKHIPIVMGPGLVGERDRRVGDQQIAGLQNDLTPSLIETGAARSRRSQT